MAPSKEVLIRIYRDMVRTRALDEQLIASLREGKNPGSWHSGIGQEAIVAAVATLRPDDYCGYTHRGCYVWVTKGIPMREILAEFYGKASGCCKGKGGTHIASLEHGIFGRSGTQGGHFPLACGQGLAAKFSGKGQVAMVFFGDGCSCRGTLHESMNMASLWQLPVIWMCENNGYAMAVPQAKSTTLTDVAELAHGYSTPSVVVDVKRQGKDITVVATGYCVTLSLQAATELAKEGIEVEVVDPRTLEPLDLGTILGSVEKTGRLLVADEDAVRCGVASEICFQVQEQAFKALKAPVGRVGNLNVPVPYSPVLEREVLPSAKKIAAGIRQVMAYKA
ncbi:MAG: thiamine pyrophosphate-dependent enzyme [Chloroflexi bacterium]|nr:thiamine pyrophosphate-dependent enzyme [Chloroflexota bacterium]